MFTIYQKILIFYTFFFMLFSHNLEQGMDFYIGWYTSVISQRDMFPGLYTKNLLLDNAYGTIIRDHELNQERRNLSTQGQIKGLRNRIWRIGGGSIISELRGVWGLLFLKSLMTVCNGKTLSFWYDKWHAAQQNSCWINLYSLHFF